MTKIIKYLLLFIFFTIYNYNLWSQTPDKELIEFLKVRNQFSDSLNNSNEITLFNGTYYIICETNCNISSNKIAVYSFGSYGSHAKNYVYVSIVDTKNKSIERVFLEMSKLHLDIEKLEKLFSNMPDSDKIKAFSKTVPILITLYKKNL